MLCKDIMKSEVHCLTQEDTIQTAATKMRDENVGFLPVCDADRQVIGTLTDRDLATRALAESRPVSTRVLDVMTPVVFACTPDEDVRQAEDLMGQHRVSRVVCTERDGTLAGVISLSDIAQREDDQITAQTLRRVTSREAYAVA